MSRSLTSLNKDLILAAARYIGSVSLKLSATKELLQKDLATIMQGVTDCPVCPQGICAPDTHQFQLKTLEELVTEYKNIDQLSDQGIQQDLSPNLATLAEQSMGSRADGPAQQVHADEIARQLDTLGTPRTNAIRPPDIQLSPRPQVNNLERPGAAGGANPGEVGGAGAEGVNNTPNQAPRTAEYRIASNLHRIAVKYSQNVSTYMATALRINADENQREQQLLEVMKAIDAAAEIQLQKVTSYQAKLEDIAAEKLKVEQELQRIKINFDSLTTTLASTQDVSKKLIQAKDTELLEANNTVTDLVTSVKSLWGKIAPNQEQYDSLSEDASDEIWEAVFSSLQSAIQNSPAASSPDQLIQHANILKASLGNTLLSGSEGQGALIKEAERVEGLVLNLNNLVAGRPASAVQTVMPVITEVNEHFRQYAMKVNDQLYNMQNITSNTTQQQTSATIRGLSEYEKTMVTDLVDRVTAADISIRETLTENPVSQDTSKRMVLQLSKTTAPSLAKKLLRLQTARSEFSRQPSYLDITRAKPSTINQADTKILLLESKVQSWEEDLNTAVRRTEVDIQRSSTLLPKLVCEVFNGYEAKNDVYQFLDTFDRVAGDAVSKEDAANLLFANYLSDDVQNMVNNVQTDLKAMKERLIREYGVPVQLINSRLKKLEVFKSATVNPEQIAKYWAGLLRSLQSLEQTVIKHGDEKNNLRGEVYHRSVIQAIIANTKDQKDLLDFLLKKSMEVDGGLDSKGQYTVIMRYAQVKVERAKLEIEMCAPNRTSQSFHSIETTTQEVQPSAGNSPQPQPQPQPQTQPQAQPVDFAAQLQQLQQQLLTMQTSQTQPQPQLKPQKEKQVAKLENMQKRSDRMRIANASGIPLAARQAVTAGTKHCCFTCDDMSHEFPNCEKFMDTDIRTRSKRASQANVCRLCLSPACIDGWIADPNKIEWPRCLQPTKALLTCEPCGRGECQFGRKQQVSSWICEAHGSILESAQAATVAKIKLQHPGMTAIHTPNFHAINIHSTSARQVRSTQLDKVGVEAEVEEARRVAFNTETGVVVSHQLLRDQQKIVPAMTSPGTYFLQHLRLGQVEVIAMFDSGSTSNAAPMQIITCIKMTCIDPNPMAVTVAGKTLLYGTGLFSATLGPDTSTGSYYELDIVGMEQVTGTIPEIDLSEAVKKVLQYDKNNLNILQSEKFPGKVGGAETGLLIGMSNGYLQPQTIYSMQNGLVVARSRFTDINGSTLVIGGQLNSSVSIDHINCLYKPNKLEEQVSLCNCQSLPCSCFEPYCGRKEEPLIYVEADPSTPSIHAFSAIGTAAEDLLRLLLPESSYCPPVDCTNALTQSATTTARCIMCLQCNCQEKILHSSAMYNEFNTTAFKKMNKTVDRFQDDTDPVGTNYSYRCPTCASCQKCRQFDTNRPKSMLEEAEQAIIDKGIRIDIQEGKTYSKLPFIRPPTDLIKVWQARKASTENDRTTNRSQAMKVLKSQLNKPKEQREMATAFWDDITKKGYVIKKSSLPLEVQQQIDSAPVRHFYPWRLVFKDSVSTPCRIVVDPLTSALNMMLAKGINTLNNLQMIHVKFMVDRYTYTLDVRKMYNSVSIEESEYCYQLVLWTPDLEDIEKVEEHIFVTLMYGAKPSGNIAETSLRMLADLNPDKPMGKESLHDRTFVDDTLSGEDTEEDRDQSAKEVQEIGEQGGFKTKCVTFSGKPPHENASSDGVHCGAAGYKWASEADRLSLGAGSMNFNKSERGKKSSMAHPIITIEDLDDLVVPQDLTRKIILGKIMELWDITGKIEPLKVQWKLVYQETLEKLDWDQSPPPETREQLMQMLEQMVEVRKLTWPRCVVPQNAKEPLVIDLVWCADGSQKCSGAGVWARVEQKDGNYHSQLLLGRSELTRETVPRNELLGIVIGINIINIVLNGLGSKAGEIIGVTDSQVALWWVNKDDIKLKRYVYNRVQHVAMFKPKKSQIYHVAGEDNPSDHTTKKGQTVETVMEGSDWFNGPDWMRLPKKKMKEHLTTYEQMLKKLSTTTKKKLEVDAQVEIFPEVVPGFTRVKHTEFPGARPSVLDFNNMWIGDTTGFQCSKHCLEPTFNSLSTNKEQPYLVDIVALGWRKANRIVAIVHHFVNKLKHAVHKTSNSATEQCMECNPAPLTKKGYMARLHNKHSKKSAQVTVEHEKNEEIDKVQYNTCEKLKWSKAQKEWQQATNQWVVVTVSETALQQAAQYWVRKASEELPKSMPAAKLAEYTLSDGIYYYGGRMQAKMDAKERDLEMSVFFDKPSTSFYQPVLPYNSKITYMFCLSFHWDVYPHRGAELTARCCLEVFHITRASAMFSAIRNHCRRCRWLNRRFLKVEIGQMNPRKWSLSPPFYSSLVDIMGPLKSYSQYNKRQACKAWLLVITCCTTSAVSIRVMERYDTTAVTLAMTRHSCTYGWGKYLLIDPGSQLIKMGTAEISIKDLHTQLNKKVGLIVDQSPAGGHHHRGQVETMIKKIREVMKAVQELQLKQSHVEWETTAMQVANAINNLPIARVNSHDRANSRVVGSELDVITPNRLLMGRNNFRALDGPVCINNMPDMMLEHHQDITATCLKILYEHAHRFIPKPKWFKGNETVEPGDVVLFIKDESPTGKAVDHNWRMGRVIAKYKPVAWNQDDQEQQQDDEDLGKFRLTIQYANATTQPGNFLKTERSIRHIIIIHKLNELEPGTLEYQMALSAQIKYQGSLNQPLMEEINEQS